MLKVFEDCKGREDGMFAHVRVFMILHGFGIRVSVSTIDDNEIQIDIQGTAERRESRVPEFRPLSIYTNTGACSRE